MAKIDIISGFLGAGKTTLIKKLLGEALKGQQVVLIENEFGEIGIDGGFLKDAGVNIIMHMYTEIFMMYLLSLTNWRMNMSKNWPRRCL